jgi:tetratricopeptide (TPR) repeat protein
MGRHDWYRRTTWTANDQRQFRERLARCRSDGNRAQYLRIQALYLEEAGLIEAALGLLTELLRDHRDSRDVAQAHLQLAGCHEKRGRIAEALTELRRALAAEARQPNGQIGAWLEFGRIAVEHALVDLYDEFLNLVVAREDRPGGLACWVMFPDHEYLLNACLAVIYASRGEGPRAREHARGALVAADRKHSGFRYHPRVGLVKDTHTALFRRISALGSDG